MGGGRGGRTASRNSLCVGQKAEIFAMEDLMRSGEEKLEENFGRTAEGCRGCR